MALKKTIELQNGTSGEYLRISSAHITNGSNDCSVKVQLWKDSTVRSTTGKIPMDEFCLDITKSGEGNELQRCYNGIKDLADFSDAEDI